MCLRVPATPRQKGKREKKGRETGEREGGELNKFEENQTEFEEDDQSNTGDELRDHGRVRSDQEGETDEGAVDDEAAFAEGFFFNDAHSDNGNHEEGDLKDEAESENEGDDGVECFGQADLSDGCLVGIEDNVIHEKRQDDEVSDGGAEEEEDEGERNDFNEEFPLVFVEAAGHEFKELVHEEGEENADGKRNRYLQTRHEVFRGGINRHNDTVGDKFVPQVSDGFAGERVKDESAD